MATNNRENGGRYGAVRDRDQVYNPRIGKWVKRDENGQFIDVKGDGTPFKGVRKVK